MKVSANSLLSLTPSTWQTIYHHLAHSRVWPLLLVTVGSLSNLVYTCTLPFVCLGVIAGATLPRRRALVAVSLVWFANQLCGYGLHNYPRTPNSVTWGLVLLGATVLVTQLASYWPLFAQGTQSERYLRLALQFMGGFIAFELVILLAGFVLENVCVLTGPILWSIFLGNALWLLALSFVHVGLALRQHQSPNPVV
jgi:hypothetical protein